MNAPAAAVTVAAATLPKPTLELLPLAAITPSSTHIQTLRRARFDQKALAELADSIKQVGVLQPIVVRLFGLAGRYELVVGERRWLAAKLAGVAEIRASVCVLSPEQVLEVQLVENLQREGLHELEEAEGYEELMKLKQINADAVADMVGKSRSYVYARTKLLALCPEARKAFYAGELDASRALLVARIGHHDTQRQAMKDLARDKWDGPMSYREAREHIVRHYMLKLAAAPFDPLDAALLPKAGTCAACPKRTGNQRDLFGDVKNADVCTDPKCFDEKRQAHYAGARRKLEAQGKKIIHGDAAKKIIPNWDGGNDHHVHGGYKRLDETSYASGRGRRTSELLGEDYEPILVQHPGTGKIIEVATEAAIARASQSSAGARSSRSSGKAQPGGPGVDEMLTWRLAKLIHDKAPKDFGKAWLLDLATQQLERLNTRGDSLEAVALAWGWGKSAFSRGYRTRLPAQVANLGARDLVLLMFHLIFACGPYTRDEVLKLFGISEQKTRELIIEERRQAAAKARADARATKAPQASTAKRGSQKSKPTKKGKKK